MTTAVQHRRGTTAEHATFTGLEGEVTIDTTKDTAVIHDGVLAGGYPLAKENLANVTTSGLSSIDGASTASDDKFFIYDQSATSLKTITRAELNNAMEQDALANVAITGGTINGTTIGGTTAAAASVTTLTTSSTVTHNGGTANGVAYLNGSKVLTTGSALTFDGANLTNTQTVASPIGIVLNNNSASTSAGTKVLFQYNGTTTGSIISQFDGGDFNNTYSASKHHIWVNGVSETMRLTSTGLGIGTSSPGVKLDVNGTCRVTTEIRVKNTAGNVSYLTFEENGNGSSATFISGDARTSGNIGFWTNSTQRMTLDASGNLGLGVTPSATAGGYKAIQNGNLTLMSRAAGDDAYITANGYFDGAAWRYIYSAKSSKYESASGQHAWFVAPSGTAGDAISFTQSMTLDASGNLGIGTSSPASKLHVAISSANTTNPFSSAPNSILLQNTSNTAGNGSYITNAFSNGNQNAYIGFVNVDQNYASAIVFATATTGASNYGERMRLDSSGNLGIGTSSPITQLHVVGGIYTKSGTLPAPLTSATNSFSIGNGTGVVQFASNGINAGAYGGFEFIGRKGDSSDPLTRLLLDSSGNLGLGVTPSAWIGLTTQQISYGSVAATTSEIDVSHNAYYSSTGWKYIANGYATNHYQASGAYIWRTAPSGTAGDAISFTQAMTLDASGSLLVGRTARLNTEKFSVLQAAGADGIALTDATNATAFLSIVTAGTALNTNGALLFGTGSSYTERARIDSSGNFTIGGQTATRLEVNLTENDKVELNAVDSTNTARNLVFSTGDTERARIDTSGNLLINATSGDNNAKLQLGGTSTTMRFVPTVDNTGYVGQSTHRWAAIYAANGTIQTSDGREKNTIENSVLGLDFVKALRPVSFKWNVGENVVTYDEEGNQVVTPRPGTRTHFGFIAQEVKEVLGKQDFGGYVEEQDGRLGLRYDQFISPLVKAIQEQQAMIQLLTDRIAALEAK